VTKIEHTITRLEQFYGVVSAPPQDPFILFVWEVLSVHSIPRKVESALAALKRPSRVILHTDSQYVQKGITEWIHGWKARGWKTAAKAPVKNVDLWRKLDQVIGGHHIDWMWVKGHAGNAGNERADALANKGVEAILGNAELADKP